MFRLWAVLVVVLLVNEHCVHGSKCYTDDSRSGNCMELKHCKVALKAFRKCGLQPSKCETGLQKAEVCCPKRSLGIIERPIDYSCNTNSYSRRLIGEAVNNLTLYPHAAALGYAVPNSKHYFWVCGGTLIHTRYVLTAAHCIKSTGVKMVLVGAIDVLDINNPYSQKREIDTVIPHPHYSSKKQYNDIGLVRLKEHIDETPYVNPACLLTTENVRIDEVTIIGWGVGSNDAALSANQKRILRVAHMSVIQCPRYREAVTLRKYIICAKGEKHAACRGDSGGPLQVYFPENGRLYVMGVYSYGSGRCTSNTPSQFIRLAPFLDWIEREVWPIERCVYDNGLLK